MPDIQWNARDGVYVFSTQAVRGTLMPGGPRMGIQSLVADRSGRDWVLGPSAPGRPQNVGTARTRLLGLGRILAAGHELASGTDLSYEHYLVGSTVVTAMDVSLAEPIAITCRWEIAESGQVALTVEVEAAGPVPDFCVECVSCCLLPKNASSPLLLLGDDRAPAIRELHEWLAQGGTGTIRSFAADLGQGTDADVPADAVGYPLIAVPDGDQACVAFGHPSEARCMRVFAESVGGLSYLGHEFRLLGHDLEKGVLFRAGVQVAVVDWSEQDRESGVELARRFGPEPR